MSISKSLIPPVSGQSPTVCIDGYNLGRPRGTGIATYCRTLLSGMNMAGIEGEILYGTLTHRASTGAENEDRIARNDDADKFMGRQPFFWRTAASGFGRIAHPVPYSTSVPWPLGRPDAKRYWLAPSLYRFANRSFRKYGVETPVRFQRSDQVAAPAAMHWTAPLPLHAPGMPNIYTFHDLIPLTFPHLTTDNVEAYKRLCRAVIRRADHIAVVSEATRLEVVKHFGVPEERITNTYQSVDLPLAVVEASSLEVTRWLQANYGLEFKSYFLHFGAIEPKKNLGRIVAAYQASRIEARLVIVGSPAWKSEPETRLLEEIRREGGALSSRIVQYDYLPRFDLGMLVRGAKATIFPSLYEGFGLPMLESMTLGTPTLASKTGSLPEIADGAAVLVDPYDVTSIAQGMRLLDADECALNELSQKGLVRAQAFTPEAYSQRLKVLYGRIGTL